MNNEMIAEALTKDECAYIHDVVMEATWDTAKVNLSDEQCKKLFLRFESTTIGLAILWGLSDTVVRDNMYEEIQNDPSLLEGL